MEGQFLPEVFEPFLLGEDDGLPTFVDSEIQEFAPSMEVQALEIRDVFAEIPQLQYDAWVNMDVNERLNALQQLENRVSEIGNRPPMGIVLGDLESGIAGECRYGEGVIMMSADSVADNDLYKDNLDTLFHEGRHAYQFHNLFSGEVVEKNEELLNAWRVNIEVLGYETGDSLLFKEIGLLRYYTQPTEVDARTFANEVMRAINV